MKGFFKFTLAGMLGTVLALVLMGFLSMLMMISIASFADTDIEVEDKTILELNFDTPIADRSSIQPDFANFSMKKTLGIKDVVDVINKAKSDEKIKGIWLNLSILPAGAATIEEVRNALLKYKESGKFIIASADFYTHKSYYLATVADKIYLTPEGGVQFFGLSAQIMLFKSMLEKIGIEPEIIRHGKFKSAVEPFMLNEISEANREQTLKYTGSLWHTMLEGVSKQRNISIEDLNLYADSLLINSSGDAVKYKLVDDLKYYDQVEDELKSLTEIKEEKKLNLISMNKYSKVHTDEEVKKAKKYTKTKIAVIYAAGSISSGTGDDESIGSETLSKAIRKARKDSSVKAIVLRVNSPGGSALASEVIWRETVLAKETKPFIVSMGDVAASGGYYIACVADTIVAQPNTITGSIGVFGLLFNAKKLMSDVGINVNAVNTNKHSDFGSPFKKMNPYERNVIQQGVEEIYTSFISHVAEGRGMTNEDVDKIGQGRVWSGKDAKEIGLVDVMGGLQTAIDIAAKKANLDNYRIKVYPKKDKFQKMFEDIIGSTKTWIIEDELGETFHYYKKFKEVKEIKGIQARLPYFVEFN